METLIARLGVALSIGLLTGLERGWRERDAPSGSRTAGIRTFGISGLLGGVLAAVGEASNSSTIFPVGFLGFAMVFSVFKLREARSDDDYSVTTVIAGLAVFALGGLAVAGNAQAAAAGGAALAATMASRDILHGFLKRLTWEELRSALMLAVMTAVILPVLPDRAIDPWGGFSPWRVWFFTVLTASLSFVGYIAVRLFGARKGIILSAVAGSLISSTAVTMVLARDAKASDNPRPLAGAAALGAAVSVMRVLGLVFLINPSIFPTIGPAAITAAAVLAGCGLAMLLQLREKVQAGIPASNPFQIGSLLILAAVFAIAGAVSALLVARFGGSSLLATTALTGTVDVDVAVLTVLQLGGTALPRVAVGQAILLALASNALCRVVVAVVIGPVSYSAPLAAITILSGAAAYLTYLSLPISG